MSNPVAPYRFGEKEDSDLGVVHKYETVGAKNGAIPLFRSQIRSSKLLFCFTRTFWLSKYYVHLKILKCSRSFCAVFERNKRFENQSTIFMTRHCNAKHTLIKGKILLYSKIFRCGSDSIYAPMNHFRVCESQEEKLRMKLHLTQIYFNLSDRNHHDGRCWIFVVVTMVGACSPQRDQYKHPFFWRPSMCHPQCACTTFVTYRRCW